MFHNQLVGNDLHAPTNQQVENDTGTAINVLMAVTYNGIGTSYPSIVLANGAVDRVRGITQTIIDPSGGTGFITSLGFLIGNVAAPIDTSSWSEGTILYASTAGVLQTTPNGPPVATVYLSDAVNGVMYVENSYVAGGGGTGNVIGPSSSTNMAIASWNGTTGTNLQDNPNAIVQVPSGALQAAAIIIDNVVSALISIPSDYTMITSGVELDGGEIDIASDGELLVL
jgi:hypothetical protein